ncbi:transcriptional regulator with XRE-family HTH domain [Bacillus niacini]|uniref:Transcriptional regulator with XRE-family HTH domain n=1 Tax=Neobacillus niacini TaxID=86668 RepID=A0A852TD39_9BACI|nr:helix-turn-helix transcriptional regulator [Neobacillus niacini]NYE05885.1 transcriptional regulator with XRE-family HTH domain [Neobacillus niacini]
MTEAKKDTYIGTGLRRLRKERGWTQEELAGKSKLEPRTIQKLESNENTPTLNTICSLAESFEMEHWEFLKNIKDEMVYRYAEKKHPKS